MHPPDNTLPNSYSGKSHKNMISNSQGFYLQQNISIERNEFSKQKNKTPLNNPPFNEGLVRASFKNRNRTDSTISQSSSSRGWDSSTTLNNNISPRTSSGSTSTLTTFNGRLSSSQTSNSSNEETKEFDRAIGHITDTPIVDEPDDASDKTLNSLHSLFSREHDNSSEETATLNPSLFNSEEFYSLPEVHVISLLQRDDMEMAEIDIWNHLITWGIKNTPNLSSTISSKWDDDDFEALKETLKDCISWIRFFQIKPQEFADYVWPYKQILPRSIIGNFLRQQITGHDPIIGAHQNPPRIPSADIDSTIITGRHATILASWIQDEPVVGGKTPLNFNLIYRASKDGLSSKMFHEQCDGQGPTILVIKLVNSKRILGAFNPLSYHKPKNSLLRKNKTRKRSTDSSYYSKDHLNTKEAKKDTFLFSFQTRYYPEETAIISRITPEYLNEAVVKCRGGPCFGLGPDLWINLSKNEKIGHVYPSSFQHPILNYEGRFEYEDFEVFQVFENYI